MKMEQAKDWSHRQAIDKIIRLARTLTHLTIASEACNYSDMYILDLKLSYQATSLKNSTKSIVGRLILFFSHFFFNILDTTLHKYMTILRYFQSRFCQEKAISDRLYAGDTLF